MRKLRERQVERNLRPWPERLALRLWAWAAARPTVYALLAKAGARLGRIAGGRDGLIRRLPGAGGWTAQRDLPAPSGRTFRELYAQRRNR
jgi:L-lactate dehydrogenase complex protein LldF